MTTIKLPFDLSPAAVSSWLHSLSEKNSANSAIELNNIAKLLRKNNTDANKKLTVLLLLTPIILHNSHIIENSFLDKSDTNISIPKIIKLCIQLLRNTSLAFCNIIDKKTLSDNQQNLAIYISLQLIGYSQRLSTLFQEYPSSTLWGEMGRVYNLAVKTNSTQHQIKHKIQGFNNQPTIESVLKRNILFNIFNPQQYTCEQINELFLISSQLADKLILNPTNPSAPNTFHWDSKSKNPPLAINNTHRKQGLTTLINTCELIAVMQSKGFSSNLEQQALINLIDHLSGYQSLINRPIPSAPTISHLIIGFNNITEHLIQADKLEKIQQFSTPSISNPFIEEMGLEPIPFEKGILTSTPQTSSSISKHNLLAKAKPVKTLQVQNDKYIIVETHYINCAIGDLTLFSSSNLTHKLGIIRQIRITNTSGTIHILIEKIAGVPSTHQLTPSKIAENQILSIQTANNESDLFISQCKLPRGILLNYTPGDNFILSKLIDYSPFFNLYHASTSVI